MAKGRIQKGETRNPGGMTKEQRAARDLLNADLRKPAVYKEWLKGYRAQLVAENPHILKDYADRVGGKVKEHIQFEDEEGAPPNPLKGATLKELLELVRSGK